MATCSIVTVFIFLNFLTYFTVCYMGPLLGYTGCNVTLQWDMSNSSYKQEKTDFCILDNDGVCIATNENNQCMSKTNISMSCMLFNRNDDFIILLTLTLMNITTNHTGNYTAWIKEELRTESKTTSLIVIDTPLIMELWKPVLNQNFTVNCTTSYRSDCITYYWKINGSDLQDSINIHAAMSTLTYRNVTMMDNFSMLTCRAGIENCSNILCNSYEDSSPYTVQPYYGPLYVYLSINESLVYLEENKTFKVNCLASCYPACTFRWESNHINVNNEELVIHNFNERLSGAYTCTVTNRETGMTANSYLLVHRAKGINHDKTTAKTSEVDAEAFPSKIHLLYIVLGMGGILAFAFIACLQHKVRICLRTDRVFSDNRVTNSIKDDEAETIQDDNLSGNYWTIVSSQSGELRTAIEMNLERHSEPQLIAQTMIHIDIESEEILRTSNNTRKEELDEYLNPVHSVQTEFSEYIHPVHSDPVNGTSACIQYIEIL